MTLLVDLASFWVCHWLARQQCQITCSGPLESQGWLDRGLEGCGVQMKALNFSPIPDQCKQVT